MLGVPGALGWEAVGQGRSHPPPAEPSRIRPAGTPGPSRSRLDERHVPSRRLIGLSAAALFLLTGALWTTRPAGVDRSDPPWLKGYARTIAGESIGYHSPYPDVTTALIVRATDGTMAVEWETEPVPADFDARLRHVRLDVPDWPPARAPIASTCPSTAGPLFAFRTGKDASDRTWTLPGAGTGPRSLSRRRSSTSSRSFSDSCS